MKKILLSALILFLLGTATTQAASVNVNWVFDTVANTLKPVQNAWNAGIQGAFFTAASTTSTSTFPVASSTTFCLGSDCRTAWPTSGGGGSTTTINGVQGNTFTFATGTATGIGLTLSTTTGTVTFTPTVSANYSIPLTASTSQWAIAFASTTNMTPTYTRSLFSNTVTGLTYTAGTGATSLTAGYNIPLTASTTEFARAFASTTALNGTSPVVYTPTTGNISIASNSVGDTQLAFDTGQNLTTVSSPTFASTTMTNLTSALIRTTAGGILEEYTGSACTNQFVTSLTALGVVTCASVSSTTMTAVGYTSGYVLQASTTASGGMAWVSTTTLGITGGSGSASGTINTGNTGQFAFYSATGTTLGGSSMLTVSSTNVRIGTPTITPNIPLLIESNEPSNGYSTAALKNTANDGRSQMTFSAGSQDYYAGFIGMSGSTVTNYPNTMEVGCGFSGCGMNFWSDGFLQSRLGTNGNWGFGTTTNLSAKLTIVGDGSNPLSVLNTATNTAFTISTSGLAVFGTSTPAEENGKQSIVTFQGNTGDDAYTTFKNTASGKSMAMRIRAASNFVHFDIISSGAAWLLGQFGSTNFSIRDDTVGVEVFSIAQGLTSNMFSIASNRITTITGGLSVVGSSTSPGTAFATFASSTGSTTVVISEATSTVRHSSSLSGFLQASLARITVGIDSITGYLRSGKLFGALTINGLIFQEGWDQVDCSIIVGAIAIAADGSTNCDGFSFYEDSTVTLTSTANGGAIYSRLSSSVTADGGGVFLNAPAAGGLIFATSTPIFEVTARIHTVQNQGTTTQTFIGFSNISTTGTTFETAPTAGCFFTASTTQANWRAICRTSMSNQTNVDTGIASTTVTTGQGSPYHFLIEADADGARFYIQSSEAGNLTEVANITTNVPTTTAMNAGVHFGRAQGVTAVGVDVYDMNVGWRKMLAW